MTSEARPPTRATYRQVLSEPRFRVLFGSRSLAIVADALRTVALSVLIFEVTASPLLAAITYGISFLPQVVGGTLLGSLADRVRPRRLIVAAYALECATAAVLALVRPPVAISLLLVAVVASFTPIFAGASNRLVAEVLVGDVYVLGRSLSTMAVSAAQLLGLTFGGLAVGTMGPRNALLLSAAGHLLAALLVRLRLPDLPANEARAGSQWVLRESWSANRRLLADPRVRTLLLAQWLPPAFVTGAESLVIPYASARGATPGTAGLLLACLPAGMIAGNLAVGRFLRPVTRERLTVPLMVVLALPLLALAADVPTAVVAVLLAVSGIGFAYGLGLQRRFLDAVPETDLGVAFGLLSTGVMTLQGVGPAIFGAVAEVLSVGTAMALAGAATLAAAVVLRGGLRRHAPVPASVPITGAGEEIPLLGGDLTEGLVRVGNTVRRPHQPQSPAIAAYLAHLAAVGFDAAPRWHGRDERGRDVLDYIEGSVPGTPPERWAATDEVLVDVARLLRRLHDASSSFVPPPDAEWFGQDLRVDLPAGLQRLFDEPQLISHCDVTPQNTVFRDGRPVALIDFDVSRPTSRLLDVLDTATWWVPLVHPADRAPAFRGVDVPARLRLFLDAYGVDAPGRAEFLDLAGRAARRSWYVMQATAEQEGGGWARMWADGIGYWIRRRQEWLDASQDELAAALRA